VSILTGAVDWRKQMIASSTSHLSKVCTGSVTILVPFYQNIRNSGRFPEVSMSGADTGRIGIGTGIAFAEKIVESCSVVDPKLPYSFWIRIRIPFSSEFCIRILLDLQKVPDPDLNIHSFTMPTILMIFSWHFKAFCMS
jgi:hypothetical protein